MKKVSKQPVSKVTPDILAEHITELQALLPEIFTEGKVDLEKFKAMLDGNVEQRTERYSFSWAGKRDAIRLIGTPSAGTLVPDEKESVDFDKTGNLFIEGDNLEVLKLLYKSYFNRVKMIYIDPPYNTGSDFVYPDNYTDPLDTYLKISGQKENGHLLTSNPESSGRYHSSWLSLMYPRLFIARQLLRDDGAIFVSIDDKEVQNLRMIMNEIFGEENFIASIVWQHSVQPKGYSGKFSVHHNYILCYQKSASFGLDSLERTDEHNKNYSNPDNDPRGPWRTGDVRNAMYRPNLIYDITTPSGKIINPPKNGWRWSKETISKKIAAKEIVFSDDETRIIRKIFLKDVEGRTPETIWFGKDVGTTRDAVAELKELFGSDVPFDTPKPTKLIERMMEIATDNESGDIVMDFFAGSGTTGAALLEYNREKGGNRRFILVQLPEPIAKKDKKKEYETIADISKERIRRVIARMKKGKQTKLGMNQDEDLGFKIFKLTQSNFRQWEATSGDLKKYESQLQLMKDPLVKGWKEEPVIYEVAIKEGFGLNSIIASVKDVKDAHVFEVVDPEKEQSFYVCLSDTVKLSALKSLPLTKDTLLVCRDSALDDTTAANLSLQCRLKTI